MWKYAHFQLNLVISYKKTLGYKLMTVNMWEKEEK